ncbi:unnamed protein product [Rotaria sp. Silwood2]|nr:unnamed protein product [Rotaria sp. Silwood2]CAF3062608.1 unnamed protein product [Rotaria sp. Silwood2]CAF4005374.1 unnamed protein product [Rotaria sp. Silwood2]CAF4108795.1 unnamed protein product [Rotaria sp. Silwood2]
MTSQAFSQGIHLNEKSDFSLLRLYIEQEVSNASLQELVETIQNSKDSEIIYKNVRSLCSHSNQIVIRFVYDKLPPRPEFRILSNSSQADLLSRTHPVRLSGTVIASSAILPYIRGLKYVCHSLMCPLSDRKRQKFVLFDIENPYVCKVGETILCEGCDLFLDEDINKRWTSEKLIIAVKIKEPETPIILSTSNLQIDTLLLNAHTIIVRDEYISHIRLGGKYNFICYAIYDPHSNGVIFETLHCEFIQSRRFSLPDSICHLHNNFARYHSFSFLNILSTLFCPHIRLAKYCIHVKMGLILSLVSSSIHLLIVGNESRVADILCQTALKYARDGVIHRQQHPLTLASISKNKHCSFIVSAGSITIGDGGITYLESIDSLSKSQIKELLSAFETKTLNIEVKKSEETSKIIYTAPFNSNIWAYHDSRLWLHADRVTEPTNDLSPTLADLVLPLDEIENEYGENRFFYCLFRLSSIFVEETIEYYLDSMLSNDNQHEIIDQQTSQWIDDIRSFLVYVRTIEMPLSPEAEFLLKKYFCACRRTKRTLFAYAELSASTNDVLTKLCEGIAKCNVHLEATESDMILAIYLFEISTMTRLGCENLVNEKYRLPPVLTDPVEQRMIFFSRELAVFCDEYTPSSNHY